jgi:(p)ppGpp synthase/HD superfamily hydrolase
MNGQQQEPKPSPDALVFENALLLAVEAHLRARDKQGLPVILHVLRVVAAVESLAAKAVAALHDVVEDTSVTIGLLCGAGFPGEIIDAVEAITRRKEESYANYILRLSANPLACEVKVADLCDNLARGADFPSLCDRYRAALATLGVQSSVVLAVDRSWSTPAAALTPPVAPPQTPERQP